MKDDAQLLHEFVQHQSSSAFSDLVHRHVDLVYSAALRQVAGDGHRAEEVAQIVFCELARKAPRLLGRASLAGWLHLAARRIAARNQRAEKRRIAREQASLSMTPHDSFPNSPDPGWHELRSVLDEALARLNERDREIVLLRFFQNRTFAEVGAAVGLTENAARMRVERAMDRLRHQLARRGIASTAAALSQILNSHAVVTSPERLADAVISAAMSKAGGGIGFFAWVAVKVPWLFQSNPWMLAGSTVVLGLSLSPFVQPPPPQANPITIRFERDEGTTAAPAPPLAPVDHAWNWETIDSTDYRRFIANLRENGAPEQLVHDLIALEIHRHFKDRYGAIKGEEAKREYWQKPNLEQGTQDLEQLKSLEREHAAVLRALLGDQARPNAAVDLLFCQPDFELVNLAWLPRETAVRAATALESLKSLEAVPPGQTRSFSHDALRRHQQQRLAALRGILTAEQREEYRRRTDPDFQTIRLQTLYCDLTADEFLKLAERGDPSFLRPTSTEADVKMLSERLQGILPRQKIENYLRGIDFTYQYALRAARHLGLPDETADHAWRIKRKAMADADHLNTDSSLKSDARGRALAEIADRAEREFRSLLGDDGYLIICGDWPWWKQLRSP